MSSQPEPVARRAISARAMRNSAAVLTAITEEAIAAGLDGMAVRNIAKRAGFSTGVIYGRYENNDEILVALWQNVVAPEFGVYLKETIAAITSPHMVKPSSALIAQIENPSRLLSLSAEFIVVAQRNEVVGEVVVTEVGNWLSKAGLNSSATPIECAGVALGASIAVGSLLRSFITGSNVGIRLIVGAMRNAYFAAQPSTVARERIAPQPIRSDTGNPLRDALINATAEVMSKTDFTGTTISRIARKSKITSGSIYNFYADKEALMNDAVSELMRTDQRQNMAPKRTAVTTHQPNFGLTDSFDFGLNPDRRTWLRFRQECIIATRHHEKTHNEMKKNVAEWELAMTKSFPHIDESIIRLLTMGEQAIGYGYGSLFGYTDLFGKCDFDAIMVQIAQQNNL